MAAAQQISYKMGAEEPSAFFPADADAAEKGTQQGIVIDPLTGFHFLQTHADFVIGFVRHIQRQQNATGVGKTLKIPAVPGFPDKTGRKRQIRIFAPERNSKIGINLLEIVMTNIHQGN